MVGVYVGLGDGEVAFDHFEGRVAENNLEGVWIAAISKVVDGEGMSESMDGGVMDTGAFANGGDPDPEGVGIEYSPYLGDK